MKKVIAFLMAVTLGLILLAGCGETGADNSTGGVQEDVVINSFTCDQADILIGEEATVTFTADISSRIDLGPEDVRVVDADGNQIGVMNDQGNGGDEKADDGIYTLSYSCESDEIKVVPCHVIAGDEEGSKFVRLSFWRNYTDEDEACIHEVIQSLSADIAPLNNESGEISEDDAEEAMGILTSSLDRMIESGLVRSYEPGSYCIYITVSTDWSFLYVLPLEGCSNGVSTYEPFLGTWGRLENINLDELDFYATKGAAQVIDQTFAAYDHDGSYTRDQVTVDSLKSISDYNVILFNGHGGYSPNLQSDEHHGYMMVSIATGEAVDEEKYASDILAGRALNCYIENLNSYMAVTPYFFDYYLEGKPFSDGTLIYLNACSSCKDMASGVTAPGYRTLADTLIDLGATAVIGNTDTVNTLYSETMMRDILNYMCETKEDGATYYTLNEALSCAKEKNGADDGTHGAEVRAYFSAAVSDYSFQTGAVKGPEHPEDIEDIDDIEDIEIVDNIEKKAIKSLVYVDGTNGSTLYQTFDRDGHVLTEKLLNEDGEIFDYTEVWHEYTYDENGFLVSNSAYNVDDVFYYREEYTNDEYGNMVTEIRYSKTGSFIERTDHEYTYDENGNILTDRTYGSLGDVLPESVSSDKMYVQSFEEYTYDGIGNILSYECTYYNYADGTVNGTSRTEYTYDADGNKTSEFQYYDDEFYYGEEFTYDSDGQWSTSTIYQKDEPVITEVNDHIYEYDSNGNVVKSQTGSGDFAVEYTYDQYGNVLTETHYQDQKFVMQNQYTYEYYD